MSKLREFTRVANSLTERGAIYATGVSRTEAKAVVKLHGQLDSVGQSRLMGMYVREAVATAKTLTK